MKWLIAFVLCSSVASGQTFVSGGGSNTIAVTNRLTVVESEISGLRTEVSALRYDVSEIKSSIAALSQPNPVTVTAAKAKRHKLYVSTTTHCAPCDRLKADIESGMFSDFDVVFVDDPHWTEGFPVIRWQEGDRWVYVQDPATRRNLGYNRTVREFIRNRLLGGAALKPPQVDRVEWSQPTVEIKNNFWGQQPVSQQKRTVNWNGVEYSAPVCNNPGCRMCNSIRAGLGLYSIPAENLSPDQQPTDCDVIDETLSQMDLDKSSVLLDDGCGDGRVLIEAVKRFGCKGIGIELDPERAEFARRRVKASGLSEDQIQINPKGICDVFAFDPAGSSVTHAYVYLFPELLSKLATKLSSVRVVASPFHEVPGLGQKQVGNVWIRDTRKPF